MTYATAFNSDPVFTGQRQTTNAGLDDFLFRRYNPVMGRWLTPDPAGLAAADPNNPQSWNRYAYTLNSPAGLLDPFGLDFEQLGNCFFYFQKYYVGQQGGPPPTEGSDRYQVYCVQQGGGGVGGGDGGGTAPSTGLSPDASSGGGGGTDQSTSAATPQCQHGLGIGVVRGASAEAGVVYAGAGAQLSKGNGGFVSQNGLSGGSFTSSGAVAYAGSRAIGSPSQAGGASILGAYAGGGAGVFITNAGSANQLSGPFLTLSANGKYFFGLSVQLSLADHGTVFLSISYGPGFGVDISGYTTNTKVTEGGVQCH